MISSEQFVADINLGVASGTVYLGATLANRMSLVKSPFVANPNLDMEALEICLEPGLAAKQLGTGAQTVVYDSITGKHGIMLKEPTGGLNYVLTDDLPAPITVYGYILTNNADDKLIASENLPIPKVLQKKGDFVVLSSFYGYLDNKPYETIQPETL